MTEKKDREERLRLLLNGPPSADELAASANVCDRLAYLIDQTSGSFQSLKLRDTANILREWMATTRAVEQKRKS